MSNNKPLATVQIWQNNSLIGTAPTQPDGSWSYTPPRLTEGVHTFTARLDGKVSNGRTINVQSDQLNLSAPHFRGASNAGGNREQIDYYAHEGDGFVEIPNYGMKVGDTVRVSWVGRRVITFPKFKPSLTRPHPSSSRFPCMKSSIASASMRLSVTPLCDRQALIRTHRQR